jgi:hypothetical protein
VSDDDGGGGGRTPLYLSRRQLAALRRQRLEHWKISLWHSRWPLGAFSVAAGGQQGRRHRELQRYDIGSFTDCVGKSSKPPLLVDARSSSRSILSLFYINPAVFCRSVPVAPAAWIYAVYQLAAAVPTDGALSLAARAPVATRQHAVDTM